MNRATGADRDESTTAPVELLLEVTLRRGHMRSALIDALRRAIQDGRLAAGSRLPASRQLSATLGVSRGVVTDLYDQLVSEGYVSLRPRAAPEVVAVRGTPSSVPEVAPRRWRYDFGPTSPEVALFPRVAWSKAVDRALRSARTADFDYGDHLGSRELRTALAA